MNFNEFETLTQKYNTKNAKAQSYFNADFKRLNFKENHFEEFIKEAKAIGCVQSPLCESLMKIYKKHLTEEAFKEVLSLKTEIDKVEAKLKEKFGENYQDFYSFKFSTLFDKNVNKKIGCSPTDDNISIECLGRTEKGRNIGYLTLNKNSQLMWNLDVYVTIDSDENIEKLLNEKQYDKIIISIPVLYYIPDDVEDGIWQRKNDLNYHFYAIIFKILEVEHKDTFNIQC